MASISRKTSSDKAPKQAAALNKQAETAAEDGLNLVWEGSRVYRSRIPSPRVLEPDKRLSLGPDNENLVIEGDNLQAMVSLRSQFNASIDGRTTAARLARDHSARPPNPQRDQLLDRVTFPHAGRGDGDAPRRY